MIARASQLFLPTLREAPADAEALSHKLLVRGGYIRQVAAGLWTLMPLGWRVHRRVEQIIREEMDRIGSQEIEMPVVHPADLWRASGRYDAIGPELGRFKDRNGRDMVLAMTHEEVAAQLLADIVRSWRQLPMMVYHFQTKWRDEPRARIELARDLGVTIGKRNPACPVVKAGRKINNPGRGCTFHHHVGEPAGINPIRVFVQQHKAHGRSRVNDVAGFVINAVLLARGVGLKTRRVEPVARTKRLTHAKAADPRITHPADIDVTKVGGAFVNAYLG